MMLRIPSLITFLLIAVYAIGVLAAVPLSNTLSVHFFHLESLSDRALWTNTLFSIFDVLDHVVVAFWMYAAVSKFDEDRLTWSVIALAAGVFAVPLFVMHVVYQRKYGIRFSKSFTALIILLVFVYVLGYSEYLVRNLLPNLWGEINLDGYKGFKVDWVANAIVIVTVHIAFARYVWVIIKDKSKATAWVIATLLLGVFPLMLKLAFVIYQRKKIMVRENA